MKRLFYFLILISIISLTACENNEKTEISETTEETDVSDIPSNDSVENDIVLEEPEPIAVLPVTYQDIYDKVASDREMYYTYEIKTDDFSAVKINGSYIDAITFSDENDNLFAVLLYTYHRASKDSRQYRNTLETYDQICELLDEETYKTDMFQKDDIDVHYVIAKDKNIDPETLPVSFEEYRNPDDFFADTERSEIYKNLLIEGKYSELYEYMSEYAENHDRDKDYFLDRSLTALEELLEISEGRVQVDYDKYENKSKVYYSGLTDISKECNIIPYYTISAYGNDLYCRCGFVGSDWIFFEKVYFAGNGIEPKGVGFNLTDLRRDVLQGTGSVLESGDCISPVDWRFGIVDNGIDFEPSIKLSGKGEKEYILTDKDIEAFTMLSKMESLHSTLYYSPKSYDDI